MKLRSFIHLRALYDLDAIVESVAGEKRGGGYICPLPHHTHSNFTPSLHVFIKQDNTQYFKCKGSCGAEGDVIDFMGFYNMGAAYNPRDPEMVKHAITMLSSQPIAPPGTIGLRPGAKKQKINPVHARLVVMKYQDALQKNKPALEYLERRGVLSVADQFWLGYAYMPPEKVAMRNRLAERVPGHYISIPTIYKGSIRAVKYRLIDTHPDYKGLDASQLPIRYSSMPGGMIGVFNYDKTAFISEPVFIPEGEMDVMLLTAHGAKSCCVNSGATSYDSELELTMASAKPIIVADPDDAGLRGANKKHEKLLNSIIVFPENYKDVGDLYDHKGSEGLIAWIKGVIDERLENRNEKASVGTP